MPHWTQGDLFGLEITRAREKSVNGKSTVMGTTRTPFTIEVLSADTKGYLVGWTAGETTYGSPASGGPSVLRQVADVMKGQQVILEIDSRGAITGVRNWRELKAATLKRMDALLAPTQDSKSNSTDHVLLSKLRAQWESMFATKQQIERLCTRDATLYLMVLGRSYTRQTPYEYGSVLPNPLDGEALPSRTSMALKSHDDASGHTVITWKQTADPHESARILESTLNALTTRLGRNRSEEEFPNTIAMHDNAEAVVDRRTGWVESLTLVRSIQLGSHTQVDTTAIVRTRK
ncbi:MAG: hypothetical protein HP494_17205 [Nitrospira sp.]|nr:hypothetical protein [Nitrospira sp.]